MISKGRNKSVYFECQIRVLFLEVPQNRRCIFYPGAAVWAQSSHWHPSELTAAEITIHYSCWEPTLSCNVLLEPLYGAERTVGSRVGLGTANIWFSLWQGQYSWPRYSVLVCIYFFFKGVLGIWRHNPGDFECLIPQVMFWKSSLS